MRAISYLFPSACLTVALAQTCYLPNGTPLPSTGDFFPAFQPCTSGGPSTICCATNRTREPGGDARDGEVKDECLPNGLCQNRRIKNGVEMKYFFANFCTDKDYASGKCLDICASSRQTGGNAQVTPCTGNADSQTWCCGTSRDCCSSGVNVIKLAQVIGGSLSPVSSSAASMMATLVGSATSSVLLISSTVNSPTTVPDSSSTFGSSYKKNKGISTSVIAGIIVGVLLAFAVLAAIIFVVKRRSKSKTGSVPELAATSLSQYHAAHYAVEKDANEVAELATPVNELPANDVKGDSWPHGERAELDSAPVNRT